MQRLCTPEALAIPSDPNQGSGFGPHRKRKGAERGMNYSMESKETTDKDRPHTLHAENESREESTAEKRKKHIQNSVIMSICQFDVGTRKFCFHKL